VFAKPGETLTAEAVREQIRVCIARHKAPRYIWILDEPLPRNASGKFLRRELRERLAVDEAV
jgi:long-chain acyl-CoA synthetase